MFCEGPQDKRKIEVPPFTRSEWRDKKAQIVKKLITINPKN